MSIASEIIRLKGAKEDIKSAVEKRGVAVDDSKKLSDYSALIESVPYVIKGTVTPEEDTPTFEIKGLDFVPEAISVVCEAYETTAVANSLCYCYFVRQRMGVFMFYDKSPSRKFVNVASTSPVISWSDDGVSFICPSPESYGWFRKGYTYDFIVSGGFSK